LTKLLLQETCYAPLHRLRTVCCPANSAQLTASESILPIIDRQAERLSMQTHCKPLLDKIIGSNYNVYT